MNKLIHTVQSGLIWVLKKDLDTDTYNTLIQKYTYINPKDESIFTTYIDLPDRIGLPGGDQVKLKSILGDVVIDDRRISPPFSTKMISTLALRDYQETAMKELEAFLEAGGTTFNLSGSPGSGKSFMLANILTKLNTKTLIIAHLSSLTTQLAKEIEDVLGVKPQILTKDTKELSDINIATSQLISKNKDLWYLIKDGIGCLVVDEAESLASITTMRIFQRAHAKYHIFISATFTRSVDNRTPALIDFAGRKVITLHNDKLIVPQVFCVDVPEVFQTPPHNKLFAGARSRFYAQSSLRQKVIRTCRASLAKNRQVLVACDLIDMQDKLVQELKGLYNINAVAVNSSTNTVQRKEALEKYNKGEIQVLIGFGTLNAGLSIPRISTIIRIATPNSPEKLEQLIGRGRRDFEGKDGCFVIDFFIKGFNIASRERLYVKKRRLEDWKVFRISWENFEEKILKGF